MEPHKIIEGFAVETVEKLIFAVKGLVHPPDRLIAYVRYLPDSTGDRIREGVNYRRVYHFNEQHQIIQTQYPVYLHDEPDFGIRMQSVPLKRIQQVYDPRDRVADIYAHGPNDRIEKNALALVRLLGQTANVPSENLGISGSVLFGLYHSESDIDIVVYGETEGRAVHQALRGLLDNPAESVYPLDRDQLMALHASHQPELPLSFAEFARIQSRKVNEFFFKEFQCFIMFVKWPDQWGERYADPSFEQLGSAMIRAQVKEDRDSIFTPCRYLIEDVSFLDGRPESDLREVISFRGLFSDQARAGEWIQAKGSLERVIPQSDPVYYRLTVGGQVGDYLVSRTNPQLLFCQQRL
jgi:predicted nucleotidyltransferase